MAQKRDLRVQKTYDALFRAFEELLTRKSFEAISVTELCDAARIRTATFYKHFADKYAFAAFMVSESRTNYYEKARAEQFSAREDYYINLLRAGFAFWKENVALIQAVDSDSMMGIIAATTGEPLRQELIQSLRQDAAAGLALPAVPELTAEILIGAINQTVRWWMQHRREMSEEAFLQQMRPFIHRMLYAG